MIDDADEESRLRRAGSGVAMSNRVLSPAEPVAQYPARASLTRCACRDPS
jgi:hypothetical protein